MDKILPILSELQRIRGDVPTYVMIDDIQPKTWVGVENALENKDPGEEIDIILNSPGGTAEDAYKMIRAFREKYKIVNVIVPFWAKSAATLFSFGSSRLVLHSRGELGAIDAQIKKDDEKLVEGMYSSALVVQSSLNQIEKRSREGMLEMFTQLRTYKKDSSEGEDIARIGRKHLAEMLLDYSAKFYTPLLQKIDPSEMGQMARALDIGKMYARRILKQYNPQTQDKEIDTLLYFLVYECPDHGYIVDYSILRSFLPFVIKANEEPFGNEYYKKLGELSLYLMQSPWPSMNGFLSGYLPPLASNETSANIKENTKDNKNDNEQTVTQSDTPTEQQVEVGGLGSRSVSDNDSSNSANEDTGDRDHTPHEG